MIAQVKADLPQRVLHSTEHAHRVNTRLEQEACMAVTHGDDVHLKEVTDCRLFE
jgi:hypothetical protein